MISFFMLLLFFAGGEHSAVAGFDSCVPSAESCDFYQCVENEMECGDRAYPLHFGKRLCERYLENEDQSSPSLQQWYRSVRLCLQTAITRLPSSTSCSELEGAAFATHLQCYLETGFCELNWEDKFQIFAVARGAAFHPEAIELSWEILSTCASN